ncbi:MAG: serine hydrolase domain-containing protein [Microthrixaceae bacterium]
MTTEVVQTIDSWGAHLVACSVVNQTGVLGSYGDQQHRFELASVTKLLSALAILVAVEEGTVSLEDPIGPPGATLRHLLCHSSGLDFETYQVLAPPGTRRIYSNSGYEVAAQHVADSAAMPFEQYLTEAVLNTLGMEATSLEGSAAKDAVSSAADLALFAQEMLAPTLIDPSTWKMATRPQFPELAGVVPGWGKYDPCHWGLGPEIRGQKDPHWTGHTAHPETFGHFGASGCFLWVDPVRNLACIALSNRAFGTWAVQIWPQFCDQIRGSFL